MKYICNNERLVMGTCYYPEHWDKSIWEEDLSRMKESGIEVIRIAEFAWSKIELTEGNFNYDFYDEFLELTKKHDIKVIFCTPTATPPAWLTTKYPEVLNADINGNLYRHGARRHYNYNSKKYLELSARIVEKSASHYAKHPSIVGWQIDNELNCELGEFYSESDSLAFREFLKVKYSSLDKLNEAWGTVFWNQTYTDWNEIFVPRRTCSNSTNPHEVLDYYRFISDSACRFAKMQSDILRKYIKEDDFITTNGIFNHLDYQRLTKESLDFITYDSYPNFAYCLDMYTDKGTKDRKWSRHLAEVRSINSIFGIMEQQSGANGWNTGMEAPTPRPGQLSLWTMQSVAHGADYISYFRWRTATLGTEIYWHGILDYSSRENERLREVWKVRDEFKKLQPISGSLYKAEVGIIRDYDNIYDSELDVWHARVEKQSQGALFDALQLSHTPFDYVYVTDDLKAEGLAKYKVLFYPHPTIIDEKTVALLEEYVKNGGTLIIGCRSGYKDITGKCVMAKLPGLFSNVTGADVFEYSFIAPDSENVEINWNGRKLKAKVFVDRLQCSKDTAVVEGKFANDYFEGDGAVISNSFGKGKAYYYGTAFDVDAVIAFLEETKVISPLENIVSIPDVCEVALRENENGKFLFVLNYTKKPQKIKINQKMKNMISEEEMVGEYTLNKYGYYILQI